MTSYILKLGGGYYAHAGTQAFITNRIEYASRKSKRNTGNLSCLLRKQFEHREIVACHAEWIRFPGIRLVPKEAIIQLINLDRKQNNNQTSKYLIGIPTLPDEIAKALQFEEPTEQGEKLLAKHIYGIGKLIRARMPREPVCSGYIQADTYFHGSFGDNRVSDRNYNY